MSRSLTVLTACAAIVLGNGVAHAGPCTEDISKLRQIARTSGSSPVAGPTAPQSTDAQLHHQPTPGSVRRADEEAQSLLAAALARAERFDAEDNRTACTNAVTEARRLLGLN